MTDQPTDTAPGTEQWREAAREAADAYAQTPGTHTDRLAAVLHTHLTALQARGLLAGLPPPPQITPEEDARWLAERSGHPRFTADEGWRRLLESDGDVLMAYRLAAERHAQGTLAGTRTPESQARDRLLLLLFPQPARYGLS